MAPGRAPPDEPLSWVSRWPNLSYVFDRDLFPSLDHLLSDLEAGLGGRVTVMVDKLPPGEWGRGQLPDKHGDPAVIIVAEAGHAFRHSVASYQARDLLRRVQRGDGLVATLNPRHLADVRHQIDQAMPQVPNEKRPGLARILYDGIARQIRATLNNLVIHRQIYEQQADLRVQHRQFVTALVDQNRVFYKQATEVGGVYPKRIVQWNLALLVAETLGLSRVAQFPAPDLLGVGETAKADPLVASILAGDADALDDRQLTDLACRYAGVPEDWLTWTVREHAWRGTFERPTAEQAKTVAASDEGAYGIDLAKADQERSAGAWQVADQLYERLLAHGGQADQRVLVGKSLCLRELGNSSGAVQFAKLAMGLDPTTVLAEEARQIVSRISGDAVHSQVPVRPDVVVYLRDFLAAVHVDERVAQRAWAELGMIGGQDGLENDGVARYTTNALGREKMFTGLAALAWIWGGTKLWAPKEIGSLVDFSAEWVLATCGDENYV